MNEIIVLILVLGAGLLLGVFFFGGLWWTTKKGLASKSPALWFIGSLFVRLGVTLIVFYYVSDNNWQRMLTCLLGFIISRAIIVRYTQIPKLNKVDIKGGKL